MPLFKVVSRGSLHISKGNVIAPGGTVEMSQKDADSLPHGVVEPVHAPKHDAPKHEHPAAPKGK